MLRHLLIVSLMLCLVACGSSPKTNFYVLNAEYEIPDQKAEGLGIGVWKVKLPELLNRSEIVTREGQYKIKLADFHQWAGGLDNNITTLVARELKQRLQTDRISISPWRAHRKNDYQVKIYMDRFDGELGGEVVVRGGWNLLNGEGNKELIRKPFTLKAQVLGKNYSDMAAALSKLTVQLSGQIANAITARK